MGLALAFLFISLCIGAVGYGYAIVAPPSKTPFKFAIITICVSICILGTILTAVIVGDSYNSYLKNRAFYDATVEQYRGAVEMYKDYAVIDMKKTHEYVFTDLKYQGYQEHMAAKIDELKIQIVAYNHSFILKKIKNASWFFNWYIIANDPDMKIIRMIKVVEKKIQLLLPLVTVPRTPRLDSGNK